MQQQYPVQQPYAYAQVAQKPPTNTLAIVSLILAFIVAPAGIITGHIALGKIKRTGEGGRGLALTGTILGYVFTAFAVISLVFALILTLIFGATTATLVNISQLDDYETYQTPGTTPAPDDTMSGELLDTPAKILMAWAPCDLAKELNDPGDAFYDDAEWAAAQEALAQLMDPSAESDAIRKYADHVLNEPGFDLELTAKYADATAKAEAKLCVQ